MTETAVKTKKEKTGKKIARGKMPTKRSINLAQVGVEKIELKAAIPGIIAIIVLAVLFGKFGVADRLAAMSRATGEVSRKQAQLNAAYDALSAYDLLEEEYAHFTYSGMTQEELDRVDRAAVIELIKSVIMPSNLSNTWSISGNQLTITVTGQTLQQINLLAREIEKHELVSFCTVTNAAMDDLTRTKVVYNEERGEYETVTVEELEDTTVQASIIVYLENPKEADSE